MGMSVFHTGMSEVMEEGVAVVDLSFGQHLGRIPSALVGVANPGERGLIPAQPFWPTTNSNNPPSTLEVAVPENTTPTVTEHASAHLEKVTSPNVRVQDHGYRQPPPGTSKPLTPVVLNALEELKNNPDINTNNVVVLVDKEEEERITPKTLLLSSSPSTIASQSLFSNEESSYTNTNPIQTELPGSRRAFLQALQQLALLTGNKNDPNRHPLETNISFQVRKAMQSNSGLRSQNIIETLNSFPQINPQAFHSVTQSRQKDFAVPQNSIIQKPNSLTIQEDKVFPTLDPSSHTKSQPDTQNIPFSEVNAPENPFEPSNSIQNTNTSPEASKSDLSQEHLGSGPPLSDTTPGNIPGNPDEIAKILSMFQNTHNHASQDSGSGSQNGPEAFISKILSEGISFHQVKSTAQTESLDGATPPHSSPEGASTFLNSPVEGNNLFHLSQGGHPEQPELNERPVQQPPPITLHNQHRDIFTSTPPTQETTAISSTPNVLGDTFPFIERPIPATEASVFTTESPALQQPFITTSKPQKVNEAEEQITAQFPNKPEEPTHIIQTFQGNEHLRDPLPSFDRNTEQAPPSFNPNPTHHPLHTVDFSPFKSHSSTTEKQVTPLTPKPVAVPFHHNRPADIIHPTSTAELRPFRPTLPGNINIRPPITPTPPPTFNHNSDPFQVVFESLNKNVGKTLKDINEAKDYADEYYDYYYYEDSESDTPPPSNEPKPVRGHTITTLVPKRPTSNELISTQTLHQKETQPKAHVPVRRPQSNGPITPPPSLIPPRPGHHRKTPSALPSISKDTSGKSLSSTPNRFHDEVEFSHLTSSFTGFNHSLIPKDILHTANEHLPARPLVDTRLTASFTKQNPPHSPVITIPQQIPNPFTTFSTSPKTFSFIHTPPTLPKSTLIAISKPAPPAFEFTPPPPTDNDLPFEGLSSSTEIPPPFRITPPSPPPHPPLVRFPFSVPSLTTGRAILHPNPQPTHPNFVPVNPTPIPHFSFASPHPFSHIPSRTHPAMTILHDGKQKSSHTPTALSSRPAIQLHQREPSAHTPPTQFIQPQFHALQPLLHQIQSPFQPIHQQSQLIPHLVGHNQFLNNGRFHPQFVQAPVNLNNIHPQIQAAATTHGHIPPHFNVVHPPLQFQTHFLPQFRPGTPVIPIRNHPHQLIQQSHIPNIPTSHTGSDTRQISQDTSSSTLSTIALQTDASIVSTPDSQSVNDNTDPVVGEGYDTDEDMPDVQSIKKHRTVLLSPFQIQKLHNNTGHQPRKTIRQPVYFSQPTSLDEPFQSRYGRDVLYFSTNNSSTAQFLPMNINHSLIVHEGKNSTMNRALDQNLTNLESLDTDRANVENITEHRNDSLVPKSTLSESNQQILSETNISQEVSTNYSTSNMEGTAKTNGIRRHDNSSHASEVSRDVKADTFHISKGSSNNNVSETIYNNVSNTKNTNSDTANNVSDTKLDNVSDTTYNVSETTQGNVSDRTNNIMDTTQNNVSDTTNNNASDTKLDNVSETTYNVSETTQGNVSDRTNNNISDTTQSNVSDTTNDKVIDTFKTELSGTNFTSDQAVMGSNLSKTNINKTIVNNDANSLSQNSKLPRSDTDAPQNIHKEQISLHPSVNTSISLPNTVEHTNGSFRKNEWPQVKNITPHNTTVNHTSALEVKDQIPLGKPILKSVSVPKLKPLKPQNASTLNSNRLPLPGYTLLEAAGPEEENSTFTTTGASGLPQSIPLPEQRSQSSSTNISPKDLMLPEVRRAARAKPEKSSAEGQIRSVILIDVPAQPSQRSSREADPQGYNSQVPSNPLQHGFPAATPSTVPSQTYGAPHNAPAPSQTYGTPDNNFGNTISAILNELTGGAVNAISGGGFPDIPAGSSVNFYTAIDPVQAPAKSPAPHSPVFVQPQKETHAFVAIAPEHVDGHQVLSTGVHPTPFPQQTEPPSSLYGTPVANEPPPPPPSSLYGTPVSNEPSPSFAIREEGSSFESDGGHTSGEKAGFGSFPVSSGEVPLLLLDLLPLVLDLTMQVRQPVDLSLQLLREELLMPFHLMLGLLQLGLLLLDLPLLALLQLDLPLLALLLLDLPLLAWLQLDLPLLALLLLDLPLLLLDLPLLARLQLDLPHLAMLLLDLPLLALLLLDLPLLALLLLDLPLLARLPLYLPLLAMLRLDLPLLHATAGFAPGHATAGFAPPGHATAGFAPAGLASTGFAPPVSAGFDSGVLATAGVGPAVSATASTSFAPPIPDTTSFASPVPHTTSFAPPAAAQTAEFAPAVFETASSAAHDGFPQVGTVTPIPVTTLNIAVPSVPEVVQSVLGPNQPPTFVAPQSFGTSDVAVSGIIPTPDLTFRGEVGLGNALEAPASNLVHSAPSDFNTPEQFPSSVGGAGFGSSGFGVPLPPVTTGDTASPSALLGSPAAFTASPSALIGSPAAFTASPSAFTASPGAFETTQFLNLGGFGDGSNTLNQPASSGSSLNLGSAPAAGTGNLVGAGPGNFDSGFGSGGFVGGSGPGSLEGGLGVGGSGSGSFDPGLASTGGPTGFGNQITGVSLFDTASQGTFAGSTVPTPSFHSGPATTASSPLIGSEGFNNLVKRDIPGRVQPKESKQN
ncbi:mucin-2-like [Macrobrachium rosenbergii]|uniref:mucin-2-like n=1 Tax=Macrobrachium rosenbergii TaxID=79674 RepID=UPI0034D4306A